MFCCCQGASAPNPLLTNTITHSELLVEQTVREGTAFLVNFMFSPTEAFCRSTPPACSALQPLLGLPLTGSTGGYAHQTPLRLLSSSQEKISIRSRQTGSAQRAQTPRLEDLRGASVRPGGVWPGGGAAWSRDGRSRRRRRRCRVPRPPSASVPGRIDRPRSPREASSASTIRPRQAGSDAPTNLIPGSSSPQKWSLLVSGVKTRIMKQLCL